MATLPVHIREPRPASERERLLVIQSSQPRLVVRIVERLRRESPSSAVSVLVRRDAVAAMPPWEDVEVIPNRGAEVRFVRELRGRRFDRVFFLAAGDVGYGKLQVLPFLLGGRVFVVNENLEWFPVAWSHSATIAQHVRVRLESSIGPSAAGLARAAARATLYPATLAWLIVVERTRSLAARRRGGRGWKRENRPSPGP
jgi:hypothetical protein